MKTLTKEDINQFGVPPETSSNIPFLFVSAKFIVSFSTGLNFHLRHKLIPFDLEDILDQLPKSTRRNAVDDIVGNYARFCLPIIRTVNLRVSQ